MKGLLEQFEDNNFLITCSNWFYAPDGKQYRAVWGKVKVMNDEATLGIKTNAKSANWYAIVGKGDKSTIVAGCQILYACVCNEAPFTGEGIMLKCLESTLEQKEIRVENNIYLAQ